MKQIIQQTPDMNYIIIYGGESMLLMDNIYF